MGADERRPTDTDERRPTDERHRADSDEQRRIDTHADRLIDLLGLEPHPEGGHYVETWRGPDGAGGRAVGTAILFLLRAGERSHWHRVDADEVWLHHAGAALRLTIHDQERDDGARVVHRLGSDLDRGETPQAVVPAGAWQEAETLGAWTLVSCVVTPGFRFEGFELAPSGWSPP